MRVQTSRGALATASWADRVHTTDDDYRNVGSSTALLITDLCSIDEPLIDAIRGGIHAVVVLNTPQHTPRWGSFLGYQMTSAQPYSEWMLAPNRQVSALARTPNEFGAQTTLTTFTQPTDAETLINVNIAMKNHVVASQQALGHGRLTVLGIDLAALAQPHSWSSRIMELLLASPNVTGIDEFGVGIIGYGPYGGMGLYHGTASSHTPGLRLVSAIDANPERIAQARTDFPGLIGYNSADQLLRDTNTDIVIVATPPNTHYELALAALEADKHVVVEKPLCLTLDEADSLIERAQENCRLLTVHQNRRWDQDFRTIVGLLDDNTIGEVFNIETSVSAFDHPCRAWHSDAEISGGIAYDWGAHHIDWIHQLYHEPPERIFAFGHKRRWHETTNLDQLRIHLQFSEGREATFFQSELDGFRRPKFYIQGTNGTIVGNYHTFEQSLVDPITGYRVERYHYAEAPATLEVAIYEGSGQLAHLKPALVEKDTFGFHRDLADHLLVGTPLGVQPPQIRSVVGVLELAHRSSELGTLQTLGHR